MKCTDCKRRRKVNVLGQCAACFAAQQRANEAILQSQARTSGKAAVEAYEKLFGAKK